MFSMAKLVLLIDAVFLASTGFFTMVRPQVWWSWLTSQYTIQVISDSAPTPQEIKDSRLEMTSGIPVVSDFHEYEDLNHVNRKPYMHFFRVQFAASVFCIGAGCGFAAFMPHAQMVKYACVMWAFQSIVTGNYIEQYRLNGKGFFTHRGAIIGMVWHFIFWVGYLVSIILDFTEHPGDASLRGSFDDVDYVEPTKIYQGPSMGTD